MRENRVECPYCEGDGMVMDWADDMFGNTMSFWTGCEYCDGEGKVSKTEYKEIKELGVIPNRIYRER